MVRSSESACQHGEVECLMENFPIEKAVILVPAKYRSL